MVYEKKVPIKTNAEWEKINFKNNLGPQIGGLLHDAVALTVAQINKNDTLLGGEVIKKEIKFWLNELYDIAEAKKADLLEVKPITHEQARVADKAFGQKKSIKEIEEEEHKTNKINQANQDLQMEKAEIQKDFETVKSQEPAFNHEEASENQYQAKNQ